VAILVLYDPHNAGRNEADIFNAWGTDLARLQDQSEEGSG
jgi:hypothetical protein